MTCSITQAKFTSVHVQSAGFSQSRWFFISVNQVLAFARAGKNYLLCFIPVQLYFIPLPGNLYLASRDVGKAVSRFSRRYKSLWSCRHELKAGRPAEVRRHSSIKPYWEFSRSRTFVPSAYNTVCRRLGFGKRRLREQNINRSEPAAPKSQHINNDTAAPREDFSADVNYTTADPGHSATITQQCNNQGGHERFSSLSRIKRSPPGSTATFADRACAPRESASPRLAFPGHPGAVHQGNTKW